MSDLDRFQATLRERLESLGETLTSDLAPLLAEIGDLRDQVAASEADGHSRELRLQQLEERADGQRELIETMRQEAEESRALRELVQQREIEIERVLSELDSKREIITALRRQLAETDDLRAMIEERDRTIRAQQDESERTARELAGLREALENQSADDNETAIDQAELAALRSELEARKAQIKSLRADTGRVDALEAQLDDSRTATIALEATIDQHVETISQLKRNISTWKQKYQAAKGELVQADGSSSEIPSFTESEVAMLAELERDVDGPECTVTIDMSQALMEARRRRAARAEP